MKRKTNATPTRIMTYGCGSIPSATLDILRACLEKTTGYYNTLADLNAKRAERFREIRAQAVPGLPIIESEIERLTAEIDTQYEELRRERARVRKRVAVTSITDAIARLKNQRKVLFDDRSKLAKQFSAVTKPATTEFKRRKQESGITAPRLVERLNAELHAQMQDEDWPEAWKLNQQNERDVLAATKSKRRKVEPWCYMLTERAFEAAKQTVASGVPLPKRDNREGRVGFQVRKLSAVDVFSPGGNFWIEPLPGDTWETRAGRRHARTIAHLKLGSRGTAPIAIDLPIVMHRPLPDDAVIKWAWVLVRRVGPRMVCTLQLTIETAKMNPSLGDGTVAFDLAWRKTETGLRVGYWASADGEHGELQLTDHQMSRIAYPDALRGFSDRVFDRAKARFERWLRLGGKLPDWAIEDTETITQWRGHGRLAKVAYRWAREVVAEDRIHELWGTWCRERLTAPKRDLFASLSFLSRWFAGQGVTEPASRMALYLEWWRRKNKHLYEWECNQRQNSLAMRKDSYRNMAAQLGRRFAKLVIADADLREFQERASDDEEETSWEAARLQRKRACPSELRGCIIEKLPDVTRVKSPGLTSECADCGGEFVHAKQQEGTCSQCGVIRDADHNHCLNLLGVTGFRVRANHERPGATETPAPTRKTIQTPKKRGKKGVAQAAE